MSHLLVFLTKKASQGCSPKSKHKATPVERPTNHVILLWHFKPRLDEKSKCDYLNLPCTIQGSTVGPVLLNSLANALEAWTLIRFTDDNMLVTPAGMLMYRTAIQREPDRLEEQAHQDLQGGTAGFFIMVQGGRTRVIGISWKEKIGFDTRKNFPTMRTVHQWTKWPTQVSQSPSLEFFKTQPDKILNKLDWSYS